MFFRFKLCDDLFLSKTVLYLPVFYCKITWNVLLDLLKFVTVQSKRTNKLSLFKQVFAIGFLSQDLTINRFLPLDFHSLLLSRFCYFFPHFTLGSCTEHVITQVTQLFFLYNKLHKEISHFLITSCPRTLFGLKELISF